MVVHESDLPGVGKKFEIDLKGEEKLVIVIHNTGKRELFVRKTPDADSEKLFELSDKLARQVGTIMEGAYFQPIKDTDVSTALGEDTLIEWAKVTADAEIAGGTLGDAAVRNRTGASIIAIQRGEETIESPTAETTIESGDTLVALGDMASHERLERLAGGEPLDEEQLNGDE
ncbi:cation:proton antiporter regulatory subunit [Natranaeroarchaeum aerophilus]|uniref:Potassium transporter TrkA n=1 Tax=Natranaeroarchaeum aerophilus TaxID=2917711 RepID=A0AAE3FMU3_9EURY|nr:TrkA C-terminal domain-containing protein [Natranaeroarchaeum aerophilus]MCL9812109.1 potassium transporter TrkA [Natranaeroarchaeum aerophilus]